MKEGRYDITMYEDLVLIYGNLTIEEIFDFINYFEKQGFNEICPGQENSTLCILRKKEKRAEEKEESDFTDEIYIAQKLLRQEERKTTMLTKQVQQLENLVKMFLENQQPISTQKTKEKNGLDETS